MKRALTTEEKQVISQAMLNKIITTYPEDIHPTLYSCVSTTRPHNNCREEYILDCLNRIVDRSEQMEENAKKIGESAKKLI